MGVTPDYEAWGVAQAMEERYEVVKKPNGEYAIIVMGSGKGSGAVCKFPVRDGRDHLQKARAEMMAKAPGLLARELELIRVIKLIRGALSDLVSVDTDDPDTLKGMKAVILNMPESVDSRAMTQAIDVLLETSAFRSMGF